ncbi:fibronectin type III domain-containing protein [Actinomadura soli]|uniref:Fibronectin type III domain-containing protein n=1 Tax=Actinomadura soli TaxID=2508997 RepID=A0A5C4JHC8_9ACTN|nr:fibronectin type III domain-containing protein [Actinomadura soli]TMR03450.1 fibronectin type III domain-containing protein [Actinomadura soli]
MAPSAAADTAPPAGELPTVTADPLPTWQTNGTVWDVEVVGDTAYVGGTFTAIRPPGTSPGDPQELPRNNLAAFNAATGQPLPWAPDVQAVPGKQDIVHDLQASPDGRTLYLSGSFITVNGQQRPRIAAFTLPGGTLTGLRHDIDAAVETLAATDTTLYVGGVFASVDGTPRQRLAAFNTATGALTAWAPTADRRVMSMAISPDRTQVIIGGKFNTINGNPPHGLGAVRTDATGTSTPWQTGLEYVSDSRHSWATDLIADTATDTIYVSAAGTSTFDGRMAIDPNGGHLRWVDNCKGGTEAIALIAGVLYSGSHAHDCASQPDGFPSIDGYQRLLAEPAQPTGTDTPPILHWFPTTNAGPDAGQGPRAMDGNDNYLWVGGDFTTVNQRPQQSLTRFGTLTVTNDTGPPEPIIKPTVTRPDGTTGTLQITWTQTWDRDNNTLTYQVIRDGTTVVHTLDSRSKYWDLKTLNHTDTGLTPGSTHTYSIRATDHYGNTTRSPASDPVQAG